MTTPQLALGITAAGTREVESLAAAVKQLQTNLTELKGAGGSGGQLANLEALLQEVKGLRAELNVSMAGMRTELADGFASMAKQATSGGTAVAGALRTAKTQIQAEAASVGAGGAASLGSLEASANSASHAVFNLTTGLQWNQRAMRELGTEVNEIIQGRWNRAIGTVSSLANATGLYTLAFSPLGAAVTATTVTLAAFFAAAVKGAAEVQHFNDAVVLTGGFAGVTRGQFEQMAQTISTTTNTSVGGAKEALMDLIKTGRVQGDQLQILGQDIVLQNKVSGESLEKLAQDYAKMSEGVYKWAEEHNKSMHFMSTAQLEHIRLLEEQGLKQQAMTEVGKLLNESLIKQTENLGTLESGWRKLGNAASYAWDKMMDVGRAKSLEAQLADVEKAIAKAQQPFDPSAFNGNAAERSKLPTLQAQREALISDIQLSQQAAQLKGFGEALQQEGQEQTKFIQSLGLKIDKAEKVKDMLLRLQTAVSKHNEDYLYQGGSESQQFSLLTGQGFITDAQLHTMEAEVKLKYNHAAATEVQRLATLTYENGLKDMTQTLAAYALQEKVVTEDERNRTAVLKAFYDSGAISFGDYQHSLTDVQSAASTQRIQLAFKEASEIASKLAEVQREAAGLKSGTAQAVIDKVNLDINNTKQKLAEADLKVTQETNKEYDRQLAIQVQQLAPAKTLLDNADKELDKLKAGMALDIQKLDLKTNINQLSEKDQYVQEKVLASTKATTDALFAAQELVKKNSANGGIWAGLGTADFEDGSPAALSLARMLDYIDKLKASLADMKPKLQDAFSLDFDASKIQAMSKSLQSTLADAIMNAGHDGGKGLIKVLQDELLKKPFKIMLEGALQGITGGLSQAAYGLFGGGSGGGSIGGMMNLASAGSSLYSVGSQYLGGAMSGANALGTVYANATHTGIDGLLSTNGAYGTTGGVATELGGSTLSSAGAEGYAGLSAESAATMGGGAAIDGGAITAATTTEVAGAAGAGVTAGLAAIPVYGWIALAGIALWSAFGSSGGGPKSEAGYAPNGMDISGIDIGGSRQGSQRGDVAAAKTISDGITASYQSLADQLGVLNTKLDVGVFYAQDPQGSSQTQLQVVGGAYNRSNQMGGIENVDRGDQALKDAIALSTAQLILSNLQSADIKGKVGEYIKAISPSGTADQINASLQLAANAQSMYVAFGKLGPMFAEVTDMSVQSINGLVTSLGGITKAAQSLSDYYNNFYSDAEKRTNLIADITKTVNEAGVSVSSSQVATATRAQFRALVESLDLTTTSGQKTFTALMSIEGAFATLTSGANAFADYTSNFFTAAEQRSFAVQSITQTLNDAGLSITAGQVAVATRQQFRDLAESLKSAGAAGQAGYESMMSVACAFAAITESSTLTATVVDSVNTARTKLIDSYQAEATALKTFIKDVQKYLDDLALGKLSPLTPAQKYAEAAKQFNDTLNLANSGDTTAQANLTKAADNFLQASQMFNASSPQYESDYATVTKALQNAVTTATAQSATMDDQLKALNVLNTSTLSIKDAIDNLAAAINAQAKSGGYVNPADLKQLTGGVTNSFVSTGAGNVYASSGGAGAIQNASGTTVYTVNGQQYTVSQIVGWANNLIESGNPTQIYTSLKPSGITLADFDKIMGQPAGWAEQWAISQGLPTFAKGIDFIPSDTLAMVHQGERILPAADNRVLMHKLSGADSGNSEMRAEMQAMRIEFVKAVKDLHKDNNAGNLLVATETAKAREAITTSVNSAADKQQALVRSQKGSTLR